MKILKILSLTLLLSFCVSCQKVWMDESPLADNAAMFDEMWTEIDENYVFFDQKNVNWDQVKTDYGAQISADMTEEQLFDVFTGALSQLKDGHVSLFAGFNSWFYYDLYLDHPSNFDKAFVERNYLSQINTIGPFVYDILEGNVGYLYYESFGKDFTDTDLAYLLAYFKDTEGLIIDVRDNQGGAADNVSQLVAVFIQEAQVLGKTVSFQSNSAVEDIKIEPNDELSTYAKDVVILTNRQCYSSCNVFAGFLSQLPQVSLVGDTTGGGSGFAVGSELANGWRYRYSAAKITLADGTEIEAGVAPDVYKTTGPEEQLAGKDALIEEALRILLP